MSKPFLALTGILPSFTVTGTPVVSPQTYSPNEMFTQHPVWNKELLFVGGFLARAVYELEMQDIGARWDASVASNPGKPLDSGMRQRFYNEAGHNLQFFTFHRSTPSAVVSSEMRSGFFNCVIQGQPFPIISSAGVKPALDVRAYNPKFSAFLKKLPIFPEELSGGSKLMVMALQEREILKDIQFEDVLKELRERSLSEEEMVACLQWWIDMSQQELVEVDNIRQQLLDVAHLTIGLLENGDERIISLKGIQTFLNPENDVFPTDWPLPSHLLPISISQKFNPAELRKSLRLRELSVLDWVRNLVDPAEYTQRIKFAESPSLAETILQILSRCWPTLSGVDKAHVIELFKELTCIPTSTGMKMPSEVYFSNASIFRDLPIVNLPPGVRIKGALKRVLVDLGVKEHVDLEDIYNQ